MVLFKKSASLLHRVIRPIVLSISGIGGVILALMMVLIVAEVLLRSLFKLTVPGVIEVAGFMMIAIAFFGMAFTAMMKAHLAVNLVTQNLSRSVQTVLNFFTGFFCLVVVFVIARQAALMVRPMWLIGETTGVLFLPVYPMFLVVAFGASIFFLVLLANFFDSLAEMTEGPRKVRFKVILFWLGVLLLAVTLIWLWQFPRGTSRSTIGIIGLLVLFLFVFSRMPVGLAMAFTGFIGFSYLRNLDAGLGLMGLVPKGVTDSYILCAVPLFILMGQFASLSGMSQDLYYSLRIWLGSLRGGLAISTIAGCAGFAAISSSSVVTALTMSAMASPEMKRYGYSPALSTGSLAVGGTLGILIPPSLGLILYGILTEQSIGKLFLAGFLPGLLLATLFMLTIFIICRRYPHLGPPGPSTTYREKLTSVRGIREPLILFALVFGGLYGGIFTATEAGAIGSLGALLIALIKRKLSRKDFVGSFREAIQLTAMIFVLMIGAYIFNYFLASTRLPFELVGFVTGFDLHRLFILLLILLVYIVFGCVLDVFAVMILTLPLVFPLITGLGFNPIWFGVIMVVILEVGLITPPIGMNVFFIAAANKDVPLSTVFLGSAIFLPAFIICLIILIAFPQIVLFLPNLM